MTFTPPLALAVSIVAVFHDEVKSYGVAALVISGITCALLFLPRLLMALA